MSIETTIRRLPGQYGVDAQNLNSGTTLQYQSHEVFASASLIKVPILAELYRRVEEEHLDLNETVVMKQEDQVPGSGVLMDLTPGLALSLRDLATLMITVSDNTATNLLIDYLGVDSVNLLMRRLGLTQTALEGRLQRMPVAQTQRNRTTAHDMSRLMELLVTGRLISYDVSNRMLDLLQRCQGPVSIAPATPHDSDLLGTVPPIRVAHKTGSLSQARHDSGIVFWNKTVLVVTIMSQGAPEGVLLRNITRIGREVVRALTRS